MSKNKPWKDLPAVLVIEENLDGFYSFVYERHQIWYKRFVLKEQPPWTKNPLLQDYKFTNVYRELDRGTLWLMRHIIKPFQGDVRELLWQIILYRLLNRVETFEKVGVPKFEDWKLTRFRKSWKESLKRLHKTDSVFTNAHLTIPTHQKGQSKIDKYFEVLNDLFDMFPNLLEAVQRASNLREAWKALLKAPCVGPFIAYEVVTDLIYARVVPFTEDDWVNPGPGCKVGIRLIFPLAKTRDQMIERIYKLRDEQSFHFERLKLVFPYFQGKRLTLRNIEHSLCEWGKYWKLRNDCGKRRPLFRPKSTNPGFTAQGQLPIPF